MDEPKRTWKDAVFERLGKFEEGFPKDAVEKVDAFINRLRRGEIQWRETHKEIMAILEPHRDFLLEKCGLLAEYAAFAIEFAIMQVLPKEKREP